MLESALDAAESEGVIQPLAESGQRFLESDAGRAYLPALRDRLFRLGYLDVLSGPDHVDDALARAVRALQSEAGLTVDGWVGAQTWDALQELFAFEPPTLLARWIDARGAMPALRRAVGLRLVSLGFLPGETRASLAPLDAPLARWRRTLVLLGAPGIAHSTPLDALPLLSALFDIDALSRLAHDAAPRIAEVYARGADADREVLRQCLICLLKIELWLLGYEDVRPDGKVSEIKRSRIPGPRRRGFRYSQLYQVIRQFWSDQDLPADHAEEHEILARCFAEIAASSRPAGDEHDERRERAEGLVRAIEPVQADVEREWHAQRLVSRIFDGAKRVWRFLKRLVLGAVHRIRLLARAARQAAAQGFSLIRRGIRVMVDGLELLVRPEVRGSSEHIAMRHGADFDFQVLVAPGAERAEVSGFLRDLFERIRRLRVAVRVLRIAVLAATAAARAAAGPWGWWRLLRALIDLHGQYADEDERTLLEPLAA